MSFRQGLRELGYVEGKSILIEYRHIEGKIDKTPDLIADLVRLNVDVLVAGGLTPVVAAKQATRTIPVIMVTTQDPVATRIVDNLARPGGNITGLTTLTRDLSGKRLELLKELLPGTSRVAFLWNADERGTAIALKEYETTASALKIQVQSVGLRASKPDLDGAFQVALAEPANAIITITGTLLSRHAKAIADLATRNRLHSMFERTGYVEAGGLMSYAASDTDQFKRAAYYVDKILKGAKPAELPIDQPTKFELVINLKTANQIGVAIPPSILGRADKVIR